MEGRGWVNCRWKLFSPEAILRPFRIHRHRFVFLAAQAGAMVTAGISMLTLAWFPVFFIMTKRLAGGPFGDRIPGFVPDADHATIPPRGVGLFISSSPRFSRQRMGK